MKKNILMLIIGIMIGSTVGVVAYSYTAKQVSFTPTDKSWNVKTVDEALTDLRENAGVNFDDITVSKAYDQGDRRTRQISISLDKGKYLLYVSGLNTATWNSVNTIGEDAPTIKNGDECKKLSALSLDTNASATYGGMQKMYVSELHGVWYCDIGNSKTISFEKDGIGTTTQDIVTISAQVIKIN